MKTLEKKLEEFILELDNDQAHNISHIKRVVKTTKLLHSIQGGNLKILIPAAWLHDCVSAPKNSDSRKISSRLAAEKAIEFLKRIEYPSEFFNGIFHAIEAHSFSANIETKTLEAKILQDADRLDALGAIGLARCFTVGGQLNRSIYSVTDPFCKTRTPNDNEFTLDHFFKKILTLEKSMKTQAGKLEAGRRTSIVKEFLANLEMEID